MADLLRLEWHLLRVPVDELRLLVASQPTVAQLELSSSLAAAASAEEPGFHNLKLLVGDGAATKFAGETASAFVSDEQKISGYADVAAGVADDDKRVAILDALIASVEAMQQQVGSFSWQQCGGVAFELPSASMNLERVS